MTLLRVYKVMRGMDKVNALSFSLVVVDSKTDGHGLKVRGERFKRNLGQPFYSQYSVTGMSCQLTLLKRIQL